jgi:hypothetical protein
MVFLVVSTGHNDTEEGTELLLATFAGCGCIGGTVFYVLAMYSLRDNNSEVEDHQDDNFHFECDWSWTCGLITNGPAVQLGLAWTFLLASFVKRVVSGRQPDADGPMEMSLREYVMVIVGSLLTSLFFFWPLLLAPATLITTNFVVAYLLAPLLIGFGGPFVFVCGFMFLYAHFFDFDQFENRVPEHVFVATCMGLVAVNTIGYYALLIYLRHADWSGYDPTDPNVQPEFVYNCTWPCVALRGVGCATLLMLASVFTTWGFVSLERADCRPADRLWGTVKYYCARILASLLSIGAVALAESVMRGKLVEVPVESIVTGQWFCVYPMVCVPISAVWHRSWQAQTSLIGGRFHMLSRLYSLNTLATVLPLVGAGWLVFLLRFSASPGKEITPRAWILILQIACVNIVGLLFVLWYWNFERSEAERSRAKKIIKRSMLWLPASGWILIVFFFDAKVGSNLLDAGGARLLVVLSLLVSLGGWLFEIANYSKLAGHLLPWSPRSIAFVSIALANLVVTGVANTYLL